MGVGVNMSLIERIKHIVMNDKFITDRPKSSWDFGILKSTSIILLTLLSVRPKYAFAASPKEIIAEIRKIGASIHLELKGSENWDYDVIRKNEDDRTVIEVRVPALDPESKARLAKWKDSSLIKSIYIENIEGTLQNLLVFELSDTKVESFDYLTDQPSRLIVDFYLSEKNKKVGTNEGDENYAGVTENDSTLVKPKSADKIKNSSARREPEASSRNTAENKAPNKNKALNKNEDESEKSQFSSREPATDEMTSQEDLANKYEEAKSNAANFNEFKGIFDGGDPKFTRFSMADHEIKEADIVRSQENLYIPFPMIKVEGEHFSKIRSQPPVYEVTPRNTDENKYIRLILTLFEKNRLAICLKSIKWFMEKYPHSEYDEMVRFIQGDVYFRLWEKDSSRSSYELGMQAYREALVKYPKSKLAIRTLFFTGYASYFNKDFFGALRIFQKFTKDNKPSFLTDKAQVAVAQSLLRLKQFDEAYKEFQELEKNGVTESSKVDATYLKGDIPFVKQDYVKAVHDYKDAVIKIPNQWDKYPNVFYNLADSLFWLKNYKESLIAYRDFLMRFPEHSHAGYAMTRVGELLEILGADQKRVMGAFMETFFRYGSTQGAAVARIRTLSSKMKYMKDKEAESAVDEIKKIANRIDLPKIDLFAAIMISEGLSKRGAFERSIETLLKWYQNNSTTLDADLIRVRIVRYVNEKMAEDVQNKNFFGALKLHNTYGELWLKESKRIDTVFYLGKAFEYAGAYKEADTLYREALNRLFASKATNEVRKRSVFEKLPSDEQVQLRLASVAYQLNDSSKAYNYLKGIEHLNELDEEEQIERVDLASQIMEQRGELDPAKRFVRELVENWKGKIDKVIPVSVRLARMESQTGNYQESERILKHALNVLSDIEKIPSSVHLEALKSLNQVYIQTTKKEENIGVLTQMLKHYEEKEPLAPFRYQLGKLHFDLGQLQKAADVWKGLDRTKSKFWADLADEQLKHQVWNEVYKKYTQKIPTMSKTKQE
jgi:tetratricopeptide (TPR) repeat protein